MTDARTDIPSVVQRTRRVELDAPAVAAHFLGHAAAFVLGEEAVVLASSAGLRKVDVHGGAILCSACISAEILTGGDDGKVMATSADATTRVIASDAKQRWIDHVASGPNGVIAWSAGKEAFVRGGDGAERMLEVVSTVGGLAFAAKGTRLAVAHYNGVSLWFPNTQTVPEVLSWRGSHLHTTISPDGRFVVTAMQEPTLHGWRVADAKDMRMSGYPARVRSFAWTASGKWLATSGSTQLILWPFQGKDGPMGKTPQILAPTEHQVEVLACHPKQEVVAVGYANGMVLLVRLDDGAEVLARKPGAAALTALAWSADGRELAFASDDGDAGIVDLG
ncbi:MAG: WD40 repeat domain-containing protein [Xanthobacteraceae bacterium]